MSMIVSGFLNNNDLQRVETYDNSLSIENTLVLSELSDSKFYLVSLKEAAAVFDNFVEFMRSHIRSRFIFIGEDEGVLSDEEFSIRMEPNSELSRYSPEAAVIKLKELSSPIIL